MDVFEVSSVRGASRFYERMDSLHRIGEKYQCQLNTRLSSGFHDEENPCAVSIVKRTAACMGVLRIKVVGHVPISRPASTRPAFSVVLVCHSQTLHRGRLY